MLSGFPGDADLDEHVTFSDFLILSANFGKTEAEFTDGDFDQNGTVEFADFLTLASAFGRSYEVQSVTVRNFAFDTFRYRITGFRTVFQDAPGPMKQIGLIDFDGTVTSFSGPDGEITPDGTVLKGEAPFGRITPDGEIFVGEFQRGTIADGTFVINNFGNGSYTGEDVASVAALVFFEFFFDLF